MKRKTRQKSQKLQKKNNIYSAKQYIFSNTDHVFNICSLCLIGRFKNKEIGNVMSYLQVVDCSVTI